MKALSIKQPWADLIVSGIKDIENRSWRTHFRGRVYVHASQKPVRNQYGLVGFTKAQIYSVEEPLCFSFSKLHSAIIGEVDIIDCVQGHTSVWAIDKDEKGKAQWHWVLANPVKYDQPILNVKGGLSFWVYTPPLVQCSCVNIIPQSEECYKQMIVVDIPPHMEAYRNSRIEAGLSQQICLDPCIAAEIQELWGKGITTYGSCCGHNIGASFVNVADEDILKMLEIGYIQNHPDPTRKDTFRLRSAG